jgi:hypothetical protein
MGDARRALAAAQGEIAAGDRPAAILMLASARARLGLIDERLAGAAGLETLRGRVRASSLQLAAAQDELRDGRDPSSALFARWLAASHPLETDIAAAEPGTLFAAERLRAAVHARPAS